LEGLERRTADDQRRQRASCAVGPPPGHLAGIFGKPMPRSTRQSAFP